MVLIQKFLIKILLVTKKFIADVNPDFVKIMSDGFFTYPNEQIREGITSIKELEGITSIGENHPWIEKQIELAKKIP